MTSSAHLPATIATSVEYEEVVKKSRFIAHAHPLSAAGDADDTIAAIRKRHWSANHNCIALVSGVTGERARSSDDGEPSGTAGAPMLEVLRRRHLTDILVVVTRYFGGVKLGAGGLVRAYSGATAEVLDRCELVHREVLTQVTVAVSYADVGRLGNMIREWADAHGAVWSAPVFAAEATFELWVPGAQVGRLTEDVAAASAGAVIPVIGGEKIVDVPSR